jgi:hypothetical protein
MGYALAVNKAWDGLARTGASGVIGVKFLADEYSVDCAAKKVLSLSCNAPAKDFTSVIILHYLAQKSKGLPQLTGEWLTFRELSGIEGYEAAFRKRVIEPVIRKYGAKPQGLFSALEKLPAKRVDGADAAVVVEALSGVPALIKVWKADEEFGADANLYFDSSVKQIFCTEDIVVLAGLIAGYI